jgi:hypothetical protein
MAPADGLQEYLDRHGDSDRFRHQPWQQGRITYEALLEQIEQSFQQHGYWDTYGELRMAAGPFVRIEPVDGEKEDTYLVTADFGIMVRAEYKTIDRALAMLSVFASLVWDLAVAGGSEGLVWNPGPLPWPPGVR